MSAIVKKRDKKRSAKIRSRSAGARRHECKARKLRPKKEHQNEREIGSARERESASTKTEKKRVPSSDTVLSVATEHGCEFLRTVCFLLPRIYKSIYSISIDLSNSLALA